jgi:hypothetical protein
MENDKKYRVYLFHEDYIDWESYVEIDYIPHPIILFDRGDNGLYAFQRMDDGNVEMPPSLYSYAYTSFFYKAVKSELWY